MLRYLIAVASCLAFANAWQTSTPIRRAVGVSKALRVADQPVMDFGGPKYKMDAKAGEVAQVPFEVRFSIGNLVTGSGAVLFVYCLSSYLLNNGQVSLL